MTDPTIEPFLEEDYNSAEDDDFAPEDEVVSSGTESDEEGEKNTAPSKKAKSTRDKKVTKNEEPFIDQEEVDGLMKDAGKKKRKRKGQDEEEQDSGGEGGFVKTRSMAATQKEEKKNLLASSKEATIDVDALWKSMNDSSLRPGPKQPSSTKLNASKTGADHLSKPADRDSEMVTVTHTYKFAGETHTTTSQVLKGSEKDHQQQGSTAQKLGPDGNPILRPLRRISPFDPNPNGAVKGLPDPDNPQKKVVDSKNKNKGPKHKHAIPRVKQPTKLNVVDKSKLDWTAHVEASGAREELDAALKAKGNYLEKRDFLERVEARADEARAAARVR